MNLNELSLDVSDNSGLKVMRIFDTSRYCEEVPLENYLIEVLAPLKSSWITYHVSKGFSLVLNSSNLKYRSVTDEVQLVELPDGIYEIKQSFKPNIHTLTSYLHLRTTSLKSKVKAEWDALNGEKCNISREEYYINRDKLREIDEYILGAKYKVEEKWQKDEGKEMYDWATKLLEQYTNECQC